MQQALLLIDIQNDYFPGGAMELVGSPEAGIRAGKLLQLFRQKSLPVIHMQHIATRQEATFFRPDSPGVEIHESVTPRAGETVFQKHFPQQLSGKTASGIPAPAGDHPACYCGHDDAYVH